MAAKHPNRSYPTVYISHSKQDQITKKIYTCQIGYHDASGTFKNSTVEIEAGCTNGLNARLRMMISNLGRIGWTKVEVLGEPQVKD